MTEGSFSWRLVLGKEQARAACTWTNVGFAFSMPRFSLGVPMRLDELRLILSALQDAMSRCRKLRDHPVFSGRDPWKIGDCGPWHKLCEKARALVPSFAESSCIETSRSAIHLGSPAGSFPAWALLRFAPRPRSKAMAQPCPLLPARPDRRPFSSSWWVRFRASFSSSSSGNSTVGSETAFSVSNRIP